MQLWDITALYSKNHIEHKCADQIQMQTFLTGGREEKSRGKEFTDKTLIRYCMSN